MTPKSVGEMLVSPLSCQIMDESSTSLPFGFGASPEFKKSIDGDISNSAESLLREDKIRKSKSPKNKAVESHFGTKKLFKTPRGEKAAAVEQNFGTKRLMKTPKDKGAAVESKFGTRRLLRTPKEKKSEPVEENFGVKRIMKTPRGEKSDPVQEHFGTKRLLRSPRGKKFEPVDQNMGTKRMFKTPRGAKNEAVAKDFGTKRMFKSPRAKKQKAVEENFGTKRLLKSPRGKKSAPVESKFGLGQLFHLTPAPKKPVSEIPESEDLHLDILFPTQSNQQPDDESSVAPKRSTRARTGVKASATKAEKMATPKRGRPKKSKVAVEETELLDKSETTSPKNTPAKSPKTRVRLIKQAVKSAANSELPVEVVESKVTRGKKHVTFHSSVQSSKVETDLVEKAPTETRGKVMNTTAHETGILNLRSFDSIVLRLLIGWWGRNF